MKLRIDIIFIAALAIFVQSCGSTSVTKVASKKNETAVQKTEKNVVKKSSINNKNTYISQNKSALVSTASFDSENTYKGLPNGFKKDVIVWTDRKFKTQDVPVELQGGTLIQTPMVDRAKFSSEQIVTLGHGRNLDGAMYSVIIKKI